MPSVQHGFLHARRARSPRANGVFRTGRAGNPQIRRASHSAALLHGGHPRRLWRAPSRPPGRKAGHSACASATSTVMLSSPTAEFEVSINARQQSSRSGKGHRQRRRGRKRAAILSCVSDCSRERLDRDLAGDLPGAMTAHSVGHREERVFVVDQKRVLVSPPDPSGIRARGSSKLNSHRPRRPVRLPGTGWPAERSRRGASMRPRTGTRRPPKPGSTADRRRCSRGGRRTS